MLLKGYAMAITFEDFSFCSKGQTVWSYVERFVLVTLLMYSYSYQCIWSFLQADQQSRVWDLDAVCHCTFRKPTWGSWEVCYRCLFFVWIFTTVITLNTENQHGNNSLHLESFALCHFSGTMTSSYGSNRNRAWVKASQQLFAPPRAFP